MKHVPRCWDCSSIATSFCSQTQDIAENKELYIRNEERREKLLRKRWRRKPLLARSTFYTSGLNRAHRCCTHKRTMWSMSSLQEASKFVSTVKSLRWVDTVHRDGPRVNLWGMRLWLIVEFRAKLNICDHMQWITSNHICWCNDKIL